MRATSDLCILNSREYALILKDIDRAISTHASPTSETIYDKLADHYSLIGKIKLATGQYRTLGRDCAIRGVSRTRVCGPRGYRWRAERFWARLRSNCGWKVSSGIRTRVN